MNPDETKLFAADRALSPVLITLLKGVLYQEVHELHWQALLRLRSRVRDYVQLLGLELVIDESEGYAFLRSRADNPDDPEAASLRLIARRPLTFNLSLLIALLRKKLAEFDATGGATRLILTRDQIMDLQRLFLPNRANEARLLDQLETQLNKLIEMGFVRRLKSETDRHSYEVLRILKAYVDAQWLAEFDVKLAAYWVELNSPEEASDAGA
jgi:Domain of unknown function (DUF4194)